MLRVSFALPTSSALTPPPSTHGWSRRRGGAYPQGDGWICLPQVSPTFSLLPPPLLTSGSQFPPLPLFFTFSLFFFFLNLSTRGERHRTRRGHESVIQSEIFLSCLLSCRKINLSHLGQPDHCGFQTSVSAWNCGEQAFQIQAVSLNPIRVDSLCEESDAYG